MTNTWNALIAALLLLTYAAGCDGHDPAPVGPVRDSIAGYDVALSPLHYVDAAGRLYELLLAMDPDGRLAAACYIVDGALFASIALPPAGRDPDVQLYQDGRAVFRAIVTPAAPPPAAGWPAFAAAANETRTTLAAWQGSASGTALAQLHAALGRLTAASAALTGPVTGKAG